VVRRVRSRVVVVCMSAIALGAGVTAAVAWPASAEPAATSSASQSDLESALAAAQEQGSRVEVISLEDMYSTTYANPDGTTTTETSATPLRVQRDGAWVDVDYDLRHVDGGWSPKVAPVDVVFSDGGDKGAVSLGDGSKELDLAWDVVLPAPMIDGPKAAYDLGNGQSLLLVATVNGFEQSLVLSAPPASLPRIKLPFDTSDLTLSADEAGGYTFDNAAGTAVYTMPTPIMYGSQIDPETGIVQQRNVAASLVQTADGARLDLSPSMAWLTDPATVYPVTIDPVVASVSGGSDTWVQDGITTGQGNSDILHVGVYAQTHPARSYLRFTGMSTYAGATITSASLNLWNWNVGSCTPATIHAHPLTTDFSGSSLWTARPSVDYSASLDGSASFAHGIDGSCPNAAASIPITNMVAQWAADSTSNHGLQLNGTETDGSPFWSFCSLNYVTTNTGSCNTAAHAPTLSVTYSFPPPADIDASTLCVSPAAGACTSPAASYSLTPTLSAKTTDSHGLALRYDFELWTNDNGVTPTVVTSGAISNVASGSSASWTPSATLVNYKSYKYRVRAFNGSTYDSWSAWYEFATMAPETHAVSATSIYDTHTAAAGALGAGEIRTIHVIGVGGLPGGGIDAIAATFVASPTTNASGQVLVKADDGDTNITVLGYNGSAASASAKVPVGTSGGISVTNTGPSTVHLQITVTSWISFYSSIDTGIDPNAPSTEADPEADAEAAAPDTGSQPADGEELSSFNDPGEIPDGTDAALVKQDLVSDAASAGTGGAADESYSLGCATGSAGTTIYACGTASAPTDAEVAQFNAEMDTEAAANPASVVSPMSPGEVTSPDQITAESSTSAPVFGAGMPLDRDHCPSSKHYYSRTHACTVTQFRYLFGQVDNNTGQIVRTDGHVTFWLEQTDEVQAKSMNELTVWTIHLKDADGVGVSGHYNYAATLLSPWTNPYIGDHAIYYKTSSTDAGKLYYHITWQHAAYLSTSNQVVRSQNGIAGALTLAGYPTAWPDHNGVHVRTDNLWYLGTPGSVLQYTRPTFVIEADERDADGNLRLYDAAKFVADSERDLMTHPGARGLAGVPLQRTRTQADIDANRAKACPRSRTRPTGMSCDEYPFASTKQGASFAADGAWAWKWIPWRQNSLVGTRLGQFVSSHRVFDGDKYWVNVIHLSLPCAFRCF
jgi:hypothetical protein